MQKSESIAALAKALAAAQSKLENASKNSINPHFRNMYADLAEVLNTVRPVFSEHGLSVIQFPGYESGVASVETVLAHESGEWMSNVAACRVSKDDAQGVGSAITYLRRYSLAAVAGIAQEDDDAQMAVQSPRNQQAKAVPMTKNVNKEPIDADRFEMGLDKIKAGGFTKEQMRERFALTKEQEEQLNAL